jgi:hypothetical protein
VNSTDGITAPDNRAWSLHERITCAIIFVAAFALYIVTLAPSYVWGDSTKLLFYVLEKKFVGSSPTIGRPIITRRISGKSFILNGRAAHSGK